VVEFVAAWRSLSSGEITARRQRSSPCGPSLGALKQIAPNITHVAALLNPDNATPKHILALLKAAVSGFTLDSVAASVRTDAEIEAAMTQWGQQKNYGVIVPADPATNAQRKRIIGLAAQYQLPTIYAIRTATADGGLMSSGLDIIELFRQAAIYSDRIPKGEKPAELPVQMPTKFELVVNLKTVDSRRGDRITPAFGFTDIPVSGSDIRS
jgi:putative ABC transport system substrate-binding protein